VTPAGDAYQVLRAAPARLGCKWLFWHHDGQPFRSVSERFHELVEAVHGARDRGGEGARRGRGRGSGRAGLPALHVPPPAPPLRGRLSQGGGSIYDLQQHLGHSSVKTTEIYLAFLTPDEARRAKEGAAERHARQQRGA
jgi:integrase/recombinase XerD